MAMEQMAEVRITINRIVLHGEDAERLVGILKYIRAGLDLDPQQTNWARAILDELKEDSWR